MNHKKYMGEAFKEAFAGMRNNEGGPFGAVIVSGGKIIGRGRNRVTSTNDPTAHAEVTAIREACQGVGKFHLSEAVIYTVCEPCPMCLAAIYWANIKTVYYALDSTDASLIGFDDKHIYEELSKPMEAKEIELKRLTIPDANQLFDEWKNKKDKKPY